MNLKIFNKLNILYHSIRKELSLFLSISLGIFLFVLFFQPFQTENFDFNNRLLFIAGLGVIVFLFMFLFRITLPWLIHKMPESRYEGVIPYYITGFLIFAFSAVAFTFYLKYVGLINISYYIVFKVALICLAPPVALRLHDIIKEIQQQNESLIIENKMLQNQVEKCEEDILNKTIEFISDTSTGNLNLLVSDVAFIKSADNYVEIVYKENNNFRKKLIRSTLKNIELQISQYTNFIRCHRTCIVNTLFIDKLDRRLNNQWLTIKGYDEQVPVSRQYLLKVKEATGSTKG
ncbi:MAG: LytTR family transcriptional regulator [Bacteroidales bacterium]|nr:MAG: LytTR family transcriptional regulator [Bacteroidales bacterium]